MGASDPFYGQFPATMKRILYLALAVVILAACKKAKKEEAIAINTLIGTWAAQQPPGSDVEPTIYTFREDSTYTMMAGHFVGTIHGTFRANPAGNGVRVLDVLLAPMQSPATPFRYTFQFNSHSELNISYGGTFGQTYIRTK